MCFCRSSYFHIISSVILHNQETIQLLVLMHMFHTKCKNISEMPYLFRKTMSVLRYLKYKSHTEASLARYISILSRKFKRRKTQLTRHISWSYEKKVFYFYDNILHPRGEKDSTKIHYIRCALNKIISQQDCPSACTLHSSPQAMAAAGPTETDSVFILVNHVGELLFQKLPIWMW